MSKNKTTGCKPPNASWSWWHWIYRAKDGAEILDYWTGSEWREQGHAIGWQYIRPATLREGEAAYG